MTGQLLERDVGADDGGAVPAPPGERGADLTRREEDYGLVLMSVALAVPCRYQSRVRGSKR